ncbi:hypothetical protein BaRGS_00023738 [Batillaria attramentaria]|uniref:Uncharacterized protein n=1 Tax=Batillaria attramentaria TaxID=370345 RepID=A0ABD0KCX2_9CAEN
MIADHSSGQNNRFVDHWRLAGKTVPISLPAQVSRFTSMAHIYSGQFFTFNIRQASINAACQRQSSPPYGTVYPRRSLPHRTCTYLQRKFPLSPTLPSTF